MQPASLLSVPSRLLPAAATHVGFVLGAHFRVRNVAGAQHVSGEQEQQRAEPARRQPSSAEKGAGRAGRSVVANRLCLAARRAAGLPVGRPRRSAGRRNWADRTCWTRSAPVATRRPCAGASRESRWREGEALPSVRRSPRHGRRERHARAALHRLPERLCIRLLLVQADGLDPVVQAAADRLGHRSVATHPARYDYDPGARQAAQLLPGGMARAALLVVLAQAGVRRRQGGGKAGHHNTTRRLLYIHSATPHPT